MTRYSVKPTDRMTRSSVKPTDEIFVKCYGFLSFVRTILFC